MTPQSNPFLSVTGLGSLKSQHGFSSFFRNNRFLLSGLILVGIFSCMCTLVYGFAQDAKNGVSSTDGLGFTLGVAAFLILLSLFIIFWMLRDWLKNRNYAAALFEGGIAIYDRDGNIESVAWDDIEYMQPIRLPRSQFRDYNIVCKDGRILVLHHFLEGLAALVKSVQQGLSPQA